MWIVVAGQYLLITEIADYTAFFLWLVNEICTLQICSLYIDAHRISLVYRLVILLRVFIGCEVLLKNN